MNRADDPIAARLAALARGTLPVARSPVPFAVIAILAERRRAAMAARRLVVLVALASLVPMVVVLAAWAVSPDAETSTRMGRALLVLTLPVSIAGVARVLGMRRLAGGPNL